MSIYAQQKSLIDTIKRIGSKGLTPGTGGNFSCRLPDQNILITKSGADKEYITVGDLIICDREGNTLDSTLKPSAEALLHFTIYDLFPEVDCVLHSHSLAATLLSKLYAKYEKIEFHGYEMIKAIEGFNSHEDSLWLPLIENSQNMSEIAQRIKDMPHQFSFCPGFILIGHGLYAWGKNIFEAFRHLEGFEFLLSCQHQYLLLSAKI